MKLALRSCQILVLCLFVLTARANCGPQEPDICSAGSPWYSANFVQLAVEQPNTKDRTKVTLTIPDPQNLVIDLDGVSQGKPQKGTVKLVEGRAMLLKGLSLEKGYEIDALDGPILMYQVLVSLLSQALPDGPDKFSGTKSVNLNEAKRGIRTATPSAFGYFGAPWTLHGTVSRQDMQTVNFSLSFTYTNDQTPSVLLFDGSWNKLHQAPSIDSAMPLRGWELHLLGPVKIKQEGGTIFDYTNQLVPTPMGTLGELRKSIMSEKASANPVLDETPANEHPK